MAGTGGGGSPARSPKTGSFPPWNPEARHTRKSPEARRDGYRAHLAADPETGIITDEKLTRAAGQENSDPGGGGGVPGRWCPRNPRRQQRQWR